MRPPAQLRLTFDDHYAGMPVADDAAASPLVTFDAARFASDQPLRPIGSPSFVGTVLVEAPV